MASSSTTHKITYKEAVDTYKNPKEFLDFYKSHFGNFWVQYQNNGVFTKWYLYGTKECTDFYANKKYNPNSRQIFPIELVFDIDEEDQRRNAILRDEISENLKKDDKTHTVWRNGSKSGNHIHSFFPDLVKFSTDERRILKQLLLEKYVGNDNLRKFKVDTLVTYPKRLIALERAKHRNYNNIKYLIKFVDSYKPNNIPEDILDKFNKLKEEHSKTYSNFSFTDLSNSDTPCVRFFENEEFINSKDGRRRAVFILASEYTRRGMNKEEVFSRLKKWRDYVLNGDKSLDDAYLRHTSNYSNGSVSCKLRSQILLSLGRKDIIEKCEGCKYFSIL